MNLSAYDDSNSTGYIEVNFKRIYLKNVEYYSYAVILKKYNAETNAYDLYIAMSNNFEDRTDTLGVSKRGNTIKVDIVSVYSQYFNNITTKTNINLIEDRKDEDGVVYKIEIV